MLSHWSDHYVKIWNCVLGPIGLILNGILIVLILSKSPESLKCYALILLAAALFNCAISVGSTMVTTRIFLSEGQINTMFSGVCELISDNLEFKAHFCMSWYVLQLQSYLVNQVVLIISAIYRITIMIAPLCKTVKYGLVTICYTYCAAHVGYCTWVFLGDLIPMEEVFFAISGVRPELLGSEWTYFAVLKLDLPLSYMAVALPWLVFAFTLVSRWFVGWRVHKMHFNKVLEKHHKSLANALLAQTLPLTLLIVFSAIYVLVRGSAFNAAELFENLILAPIVLLPIINPIVTIYSIQPYRSTVAGWFLNARFKISPVVSVAATVEPPVNLH